MKLYFGLISINSGDEVSSASCNGEPVRSFEDRIMRVGGQKLYL